MELIQIAKNMQLKEQTAFSLFFFAFIRPYSKYIKCYHVRINTEGTPVRNEKKCFMYFLLVSESKGKYPPLGHDQHSTVWYDVSIIIFYKIFLTLEKG